MASIQQAMNQMLQSAQFGAGFYSHTPAAKQRFEKKQLEKRENILEEAYQKAVAESGKNIEDPAILFTAENLSKAVKDRFEKHPDEQAFRSFKAYHDAPELHRQDIEMAETNRQIARQKKAESDAIQSLILKQNGLTNQEQEFLKRLQQKKEGVIANG